MLDFLRRRPVTTCVALSVAALGLAWRRFLGGGHSPFSNDIEHYHHPVTRELVRAWSEGRIPLWTDRIYFGFPYVADPQTAAWYPGTLLIAWLGPHTGYAVFLFLHSLLAALGTVALVRSHGGGRTAGWAAGMVVALSGFFAHEAQHPGLFAILCWVPVWLWTTHAVLQRPSPARAIAAALPLSLMIFAGTLQVLFGAVIIYGFYVAGVTLDARRDRGSQAAARALAVAVAAQLLGLALAAVVLVPAVAHFPHTARLLGMDYAFGSMGSVHPLQLLGTAVNGAEANLGRGADLGFGGASFYLGALTLPLAIVGLFTTRRALPIAMALAVLVLGLLVVGKHGWLHPFLYETFPGAVGFLRGIGRGVGPGSVCLALLAGLGLHNLGEPGTRPQRLFVGLLAASFLCQGLVWLAAPTPRQGATLASTLLVAAAFCLWAAARRRPHVLRAGLAALIVCDLVAFGALDRVLAVQPPPPSPERIAGNLPALAAIAPDSAGAVGERTLLADFGPRNLPLVHGFDGVGGYNPLVMLAYLDFVHLANFEQPFPRTPLDRFIHHLQPRRSGAGLDAGSVRYVLSARPIESEGFRLVERFPGSSTQPRSAFLYENERALPRAYLAYHGAPATGPERYAELLGDGFDPRATTVLEGDAPALDGPKEITPVVREQTSPESLHFEIAPTRAAVLVVTDSWYPGWRAWVDGVESPILRANALFRGVPVAAGARRVEMRFEPLGFRIGAMLSLAALLVIAALAANTGVRWIRRGRGSTG